MKTAVVLGTFDGLHEGHRAVISAADGFYRVACTFRIPPKTANSNEKDMLMLPSDRADAMKRLGIDAVVMSEFDDIKNMAPDEYLRFISKKYSPSRIVCGFDYRFGKNASGDCNALKRFCGDNGIEFICCPEVKQDGVRISSTLIRDMIRRGEIERANGYLYEGFSFASPVLTGDQRGRTIGFPTINQDFPELLVKPLYGVYLSDVDISGRVYSGITNIGLRPTFEKDHITAETYIYGFSYNIYGKTVRLYPKRFLRPEQKFSSLEQLKSAINRDVSSIERSL